MKKALACCALIVVAACPGDDSGLVPDYRVFSPEGSQHTWPRYSPDGTKLVWWAPSADIAGGVHQLWIGNADQSNAQKLPVTNFGGGPVMWSPDGSKLAIVTNKFSFSDVAVVTVATGEIKRVSQGPGFEQPVAWHADSDRLTFYASNEASIQSFVTKTSTGETSKLVPEEKRPMVGYWSPDGSQLAYVVFDGSQATIWSADGIGRARRQLTTEGFEQLSLANWGESPWSPDGKEILYESRRTGTSDIWAVDATTGATRQITRDVRNDERAVWSSDGKSIVFVSDRGRQTDVWMVPAAGGAEQRVTDNELTELVLVWRHGTNEMSFVTEAISSSVWMRSIADGAERQLTPDSIRAIWFNLSPDGSQIDYVIERGGSMQDLAVMPLAGGAARTIVTGGDVIDPFWSRDGTKIAFQSRRGGSADIWVIDAAGGAPRQITNWPGFEFYPRWSGDGSSIMFTADREAKLGDLWSVPAAGGEPKRLTRDGSVDIFFPTKGRADVFAAIITANGQITWARLRANGDLRPMLGHGNILNMSVPDAGDSLAILVEAPGGGTQAMIAPMAGGRGRPILDKGDDVRAWSPDGKQLLYVSSIGGADDLGVADIATGKKTRLTTTPQSEIGAEWTPDGKNVVFRRVNRTRRIYAVDLSKLVDAK